MAQNQQRESTAVAARPVESLAPMRLPISSALLDKLGVSEPQWRTLCDQLYPAARSVDSIALVLGYCQSRGLDPYKKPVHIVPVYSSALKRMVETVWPGIAEIRTTATRTGSYAGIDDAVFGREVEREFIQQIEDDRDPRNNREVKHLVKYPEWCRLTCYRFVQGERVAFTASVRWLEAYATASRFTDLPNEMWRKRTYGQLEKCTEAAVLRRAFPEELGSTYAAEEMHGKVIEGELAPGTYADPEASRPRPTPPPSAASAARQAAPSTADIVDVESEDISDDPWDGDDNRFFDELRERLEQAPDIASVGEVWDEFDPMTRFEGRPVDQEIATKIRNLRLRKLGPAEQ